MRKLAKKIIIAGMSIMLIATATSTSYVNNTAYGASAKKADSFKIPVANANGVVGATMPYTRYDTEKAVIGGGAVIVKSTNFDYKNIATQASGQQYIKLPSKGAYAEWVMNTTGDGVTMRFTMPDTSNGMGQSGSLDVYVNGKKAQTVNLTSYFMWQYFALGKGHPSDVPNSGAPLFAFDEVHFKLNTPLKKGDKIRIQSSGAKSLEYGVDFLEIENVPTEVKQPANALNVLDYGATPNDDKDDATAINNCIYVAKNMKKDVYIPAGTYKLGKPIKIYGENTKITGAGMWYTNLQFTSDQIAGGGIAGNTGGSCKNIEICNLYVNSNLRSRYSEKANYKCFSGVFEDGSVIHDVWEEHFECGFWFGDYDKNTNYSDGVKVVNCRMRNNLADGLNFCQGTSNAVVYNCSIRNNGDDGLAMWNNDYYAKDEIGNIFAYNTIDFIWRAGGIAIYGGNGHKVYNNYICDTTMASGIHMNSIFDGYKFTNNTEGIKFDNNIIVRSGCSKDSWNSQMAAVDIDKAVKNVTFNNTKIYDAQYDGIRVTAEPTSIVFNNTKVYGAGVNGTTSRKGSALNLANGKNVVFNGIEVANSAYSNSAGYPIYFSSNTNVGTTNIKDYKEVTATYIVPDYPKSIATTTTPIPQATTKAPTSSVKKPGKTSILNASKKKSSKKVKISLKKVKGCTGYQIQICSNKKFKKILVSKKVRKKSFTISSKKIKNKKKLYLRARVYKTVGKTTARSAWTKAKKIQIKK